MDRRTSRALRRALILTAAVSGAVELLAAAFTGSRVLLAIGAVEVGFACILAAVEQALKRGGGRQIPTDAPDRDRDDWIEQRHIHHDED